MKTTEFTITIPVEETKKPRKNIRSFFGILALIFVLAFAINIVEANYERLSPIAVKQLMHGVERGDADAMKDFNDYIERDIYLFNGPMTIKAMADKYGFDYDKLFDDFASSEYTSLQKYFDEVIKPIISER